MKKLLLLLAFVTLGAASYGQDFLGIKPSGNKDYTVNQFKAKGFYVSSTETANVTAMRGKLNGQPIELNIIHTPISKTVCKFSIYLQELESLNLLKTEYLRYIDVFTSKYGSASTKYSYFKDPYYDGDGYELQALENEKAIFATYWIDYQGMNLGISISKWKQVNIVYENQANMDLKDAETKRLNTNAF